ncbi:MAG: hypothetical protein PHQ58_02390 [Rhodoferax sp.]|uniref:hypothetical protein n=1 Tax=Rhodoferax sp. TaxID=50421 RepID=UPI00261FDBDA|nr:hypothetical protein [Rhodoferax sp.]MDD2879260.1 hypothetical protein [Rhodoferax sp.]
MKIYSMDELLALPPIDQIADLLRTAAKAIDAGAPECAAWRLADASYLLRRRLTRLGCVDVCGIAEPTGRGALLGGKP